MQFCRQGAKCASILAPQKWILSLGSCRTVADGTCTFPNNLFGCDNRAVAGDVSYCLTDAWRCKQGLLCSTSERTRSNLGNVLLGYCTVASLPGPSSDDGVVYAQVKYIADDQDIECKGKPSGKCGSNMQARDIPKAFNSPGMQ